MMVKKISGFERYFVSDDGNVYYNDMKSLRPSINHRTGYCQVMLWKNGKGYMRYVHRLVAEAFLGTPVCKCDVNHKDGNKQNNSVANLEWATRSENVLHAYKTGLRKTIPVSAYTKQGEFVKTFRSVREAQRFCGVSYNAGISQCLAGKANTAHGYIWRYANAL